MGQCYIPVYQIREAGGKLDKYWIRVFTNNSGDHVSGSICVTVEAVTEDEIEKRKQEKEREEQKRIEEENKKKMEEQQKMLEMLNEKKKELEKQRDQKLNEDKLSHNIPPPIPISGGSSGGSKVGNATCGIQFVGQSQTELSMNVGDDITVEDKSDPNWWYAKNHTSNQEGYIPAGNYVNFSSSKVGNATCVIQFVGQSQTELSMNVGDDITVDDKSDPNWWYAKNHTSNQEGYIPAGEYVTF